MNNPIEFICSYFNFGNSSKIKKNYTAFRRKFPHPITTVEVALPDQDFFIDDSIKIRATDKNILWQKERCLNIAIAELPNKTDKIAWVDTDVIFHNPNFMEDTAEELEYHPVVHMFEKVVEYPQVNPFNNNFGIGKRTVDHLDIEFPAIGFAWAFRKEILINEQLYDKNPVGNSDVLQMLTWMGIWNHKTIVDLSVPYRKEFLEWAWDSYENVQADIGYTKGELEHMYHGHQSNRHYHDRNQILVKNHYVPSEDLRLDKNDLYMIPYKPHLREDLHSYFKNRTSSGS